MLLFEMFSIIRQTPYTHFSNFGTVWKIGDNIFCDFLRILDEDSCLSLKKNITSGGECVEKSFVAENLLYQTVIILLVYVVDSMKLNRTFYIGVSL